MVLGDAKKYSVREPHLPSDKSLTTKSSQPQKDVDNCVYEDNFMFEYTGSDDELKDWLHTNLPVAKILAGFRGDAEVIVIDGDSSRPYKVIQQVLDNLHLKARFTIGIAGSVIIQIAGSGHAAVIVLGEEMRDAALHDLVHRSNEETRLEPRDIKHCIATERGEITLLSTNVDNIIEIVCMLDHEDPDVEDPRETSEERFTKSPDFCFHGHYREAWARFKNRKLVSSVFGEVSSSDSPRKGAFYALLFVGGTKLQADLSANADLKLGKIRGQKVLKSMTLNLFNVTAGNLLELSRNTHTNIDDEDRRALRYAAKFKVQEQLEALHLLKRLINLREITLVTLEEVRSKIFGDSGRRSEFFNYDTINLAKRCASSYGRLPRTIDRTISYYEEIYDQVSDEEIPVEGMEERILILVADHSSKVMVFRTEDGSTQVHPPDGISFPTVAFSGLLPNGQSTSVLSADALSEVFQEASRKMKSYLQETVPLNLLDGIEDIDEESLEACAKSMFPIEGVDAVEQLISLLRNSKRKSSQIELQYLTCDALIRIGRRHYEVPSNASESLALAYAVQSILDDRKKEMSEKKRNRDN